MGDRHPWASLQDSASEPRPPARVKYKGCLFSRPGGPGERVRHHGVPGAVPFPTADWLGLVTLTVPCGQSPRAAWLSHPPGQGPSGDLTICHWDSLALALAVSLAR